MKIVLYTYHFPRFSETFIARQFLYLLEKGVDVHIVGYRSDELSLFPEVYPHISRIHYLPSTRPRWKSLFILLYLLLKNLLSHPILFFKYFKTTIPLYGIINSLKKFYIEYPLFDLKPELVHFEYISIAREHFHLKQIFGFKAISSFRGHGVMYVEIDKKDFYKDTFKHIDAVHTLENHLVEYAKKYRNFPSNILTYKIPPAVPEDLLSLKREYSKRNGTNAPCMILTVARLHWTKGYEYILKSLSILKERGLKFEYHIVGVGPLKEMVIYLSHALKINDNVVLHGKLAFSEIVPLYLSSDVFVLTQAWGTILEGSPNAVLEALSLGLPVVAGEYEENIELVNKYKIALPCERRDPEDIANKLEILIKNPDLRKEIGTNARKYVEKHFTLTKQAEEFFKFYTKVLKGDKS